MPRRSLTRPARVISLGFLGGIAVGTALLLLPLARTGPGGASFTQAVFTAASAICVTGLTVVDTATFWTPLGQGIILGLIQVGGFGIMSGATLVSLVVARRLGLRARLVAQAETHSLTLGEMRGVLGRVALTVVGIEAVAAALLALRFIASYDYPVGTAIWHGVFHAVSAFNNAGFALTSDSLVRFVSDPLINIVIAAAVILGGLGFPVLRELRRELVRPSHWSMHTRLTVWTTAALLLIGTAAVLLFEWGNPATLGRLDGPGRVLAAFFASVQPRTAGFNALDIGGLTDESLSIMTLLMFIGGGSASTAGGIKVTTLAVILFVIWAEIRGEPDVSIGGRRVPPATQRLAVTVGLLGVAVVALGTLMLLAWSDFRLQLVMFEAASAFGTVGLSTGITGSLPAPAAWTLVVLMYVGRVGPVAAASALALRGRQALYRLPEERPIVG